MSAPSPLVLIISGLSIVPFLINRDGKFTLTCEALCSKFLKKESVALDLYHVPAIDPSAFIR
jgi:hypothetical protein